MFNFNRKAEWHIFYNFKNILTFYHSEARHSSWLNNKWFCVKKISEAFFTWEISFIVTQMDKEYVCSVSNSLWELLLNFYKLFLHESKLIFLNLAKRCEFGSQPSIPYRGPTHQKDEFRLNTTVTGFLKIFNKQGLCWTRKLQQCTNWKVNLRICNLQINTSGPFSWFV